MLKILGIVTRKFLVSYVNDEDGSFVARGGKRSLDSTKATRIAKKHKMEQPARLQAEKGPNYVDG